MDTSRLLQIKKLLKENNLDAALISSLQNIMYLTNFYYFSDIEREAFLLITKDNQYILTDSRYSHAVKTYVKEFELLEISMDNPLPYHLENVIKQKKVTSLGIEENNLTVMEHKRITSVIKNNKHFNLHSFRITKQDEEITAIQKACDLGDKAFKYILNQIKSDMTEKEIALLLETYIRKHSAEPSFASIVAFGANAAVPHHKTSDKKLTTNELILLDFGVKYKNYCSDMTRTVFIGKATKEQKKVYQLVLNAQKLAIERFNHLTIPSKTVYARELDEAARSYIISQGYPSIPHSLGHGIGLHVHEAPSLSPGSKDVLTDGMVFSIEPGVYLPSKFGIRIEDLFTIVNNKLIQLTKSPRNVLEI